MQHAIRNSIPCVKDRPMPKSSKKPFIRSFPNVEKARVIAALQRKATRQGWYVLDCVPISGDNLLCALSEIATGMYAICTASHSPPVSSDADRLSFYAPLENFIHISMPFDNDDLIDFLKRFTWGEYDLSKMPPAPQEPVGSVKTWDNGKKIKLPTMNYKDDT